MKLTTSIPFFSLILATAVGCGGRSTDDQGLPKPRIEVFTANPMTVEPGQSTMLTYKVVNATRVKIEANGFNVLPETAQLENTISTDVLNTTTTFTLTAVGIGEPATQTVTVNVNTTGNPGRIVAFSATPATIDQGQMAVLSWQIENGMTARIETGGNVVHEVPANAVANGTLNVSPLATTVYTLSVVDVEGNNVTPANATVTVNVVVTGPNVVSFTANPASVDPGLASTLSWTVENATQITVSDGANTVYSGADLTGSTQVTPGQTTTYTLVARDDDNMTATRTVVVSVNTPRGATIDSFTATPTSVPLGQASMLAWTVSNAPGGVELREAGSLIYTAAGSGSYEVYPTVDTTYELTALNPQGNDTESLTVTVTPAVGPTVTSVSANPTGVAPGAMSTISWTTVNATQVRVLEGATELHLTTTDVASGSHQVTVNQTTTYTVEASDGAQTHTRNVTITAAPAPVINSFTITPQQLASPGNVTVAWDVSGATTLTLTQNGNAVLGFPGTPTGSQQVMVAQTSTFELTATSAGGSVNQQLQVTIGQPAATETEPNNTVPNEVNPFPAGGVVTGAIGVAGDVDIFSFTVANAGNVLLETSDGAGGCTTDTVIELLDAQGNTLTFDDDSGPGTGIGICSRIDPTVDGRARNLAAGTYYVRVSHYEATGTGSYTLTLTVGAPSCGDGFIDFLVEECDDANNTAGDGCAAACTIENIVNLPAPAPVVLNLTGFQLIRIVVTGELYITGSSGSPTMGQCASDVFLTLLENSYRLRGYDESTGPCETMSNATAFNRVAAGTYILAVEVPDQTTAYQLQLDSVGVTPQSPVLELEPNDAQANATVSGLSGAATRTIQGQVRNGDDDVFSFVVPAGQTLMFSARTYETPGNPMSCTASSPRTDTRIFLEQAGTEATGPMTGELAYNDNINATMRCSFIPPTSVTAGAQATTFYLRVQGTGDAGYRHYLLDVTLSP